MIILHILIKICVYIWFVSILHWFYWNTWRAIYIQEKKEVATEKSTDTMNNSYNAISIEHIYFFFLDQMISSFQFDILLFIVVESSISPK